MYDNPARYKEKKIWAEKKSIFGDQLCSENSEISGKTRWANLRYTLEIIRKILKFWYSIIYTPGDKVQNWDLEIGKSHFGWQPPLKNKNFQLFHFSEKAFTMNSWHAKFQPSTFIPRQTPGTNYDR